MPHVCCYIANDKWNKSIYIMYCHARCCTLDVTSLAWLVQVKIPPLLNVRTRSKPLLGEHIKHRMEMCTIDRFSLCQIHLLTRLVLFRTKSIIIDIKHISIPAITCMLSETWKSMLDWCLEQPQYARVKWSRFRMILSLRTFLFHLISTFKCLSQRRRKRELRSES